MSHRPLAALVRTIAALALAFLLAPAEAGAQNAPHAWEWIVSPYVWGTNLKGTLEADDHSADVDADFGDVLDKLNFALMGTVEARKDRFVALFDGFGAVLEDDPSFGPRTVTLGPLSVQQGPLLLNVPATPITVGPLDIDAKLTQVVLDLKLGGRALSVPTSQLLGQGPPGEADRRKLDVDLFLGGRYWYLETEMDLDMPPINVPGFTLQPSVPAFPNLPLPNVQVPGITVGGIHRHVEGSKWWIDPVVGLRLGLGITDRLSISLLGDVGGFGIGSASTYSWMAFGTLGYRLGAHWSLMAGYKGLYIDRDVGDLLIHGIVIGASYRF